MEHEVAHCHYKARPLSSGASYIHTVLLADPSACIQLHLTETEWPFGISTVWNEIGSRSDIRSNREMRRYHLHATRVGRRGREDIRVLFFDRDVLWPQDACPKRTTFRLRINRGRLVP